MNDYIKNSKLSISVFVEDRAIAEGLKPFKNIYDSIINRSNAQKSDVLMFFDYPADEEILQEVMTSVSPSAIHYMKYSTEKYNEESILKTFSGMIRYTCNTLNGDFNITRAAAALGVTEPVTEILLEMFEDAGMIKIKERAEEFFKIEFIGAIELAKTLHTLKYAEFKDLMDNISSYKNSFMSIDL